MRQGSNSYDVIVVGSRIGGGFTAALLGDQGHRVLVLERAAFPSDTLSTHFFRAPTLRALKQIGLLEKVQAVAPRLTVDFNVVDGIAFPEPVDGPEDFPYYLCVRRITLDGLLAERLRQTSGVDLREHSRVEALTSEGSRVVGAKWTGPEGKEQARARVVVGADGLRSVVAAQVHPAYEHQEPVRRAMYYAYVRGLPGQEGPAAEFHYRGDHLVYAFPCDGDLTLLAASVPVSEFDEFRHQPGARLWQELHAMTQIGPRLNGAVREGPVRGTGSIPGYLRYPYGPGWALVGDAGMVMDPWSGQGIDQASTHAVILARQIQAFLAGESDWDSSMREYHRERNAFSEKTYHRTCRFSQDLRPMTRKALERRGLLREEPDGQP
ncbi:MAG: NAD(P)/FAD-dependent oxidoreductase [Anaerolineales bacterium]